MFHGRKVEVSSNENRSFLSPSSEAYADTHHREVIVRLGARAEGLYLLLHRFYHLLGAFEVGTSQGSEQAIVAEPLLLGILSLVQSVGIDEQRPILDRIDFLALIQLLRPQADRRVGNHVKEVAMTVANAYNRRIMTGIAVVEMARLQIDQSQPEGDKHAVLIVIA